MGGVTEEKLKLPLYYLPEGAPRGPCRVFCPIVSFELNSIFLHLRPLTESYSTQTSIRFLDDSIFPILAAGVVLASIYC